MLESDNSSGCKVLVTGASGFLGRRTVEILLDQGYFVRALVRKTSKIDHLLPPNIEIFYGDVAEADSLKPAFEGIDYVIHAAADTGGSVEGGRRSTIQGTQNILHLCEIRRVKKLVYISSCSVYGVTEYKSPLLVDEAAPLECFPEQRGAYSWAKLEAEKLVFRFIEREKIPVICLRPGTIYGPGGEVYSPMIGFSLGNWIFSVIGDGESFLPLVYIDNLVNAIIASLKNVQREGQIYNVVDPERVSKKRYMERVIRKLYPRAIVFYFPYRLLSSLVLIQEKLFAFAKCRPFLTRYRLEASQKPITYDASKIINELNWKPSVSFENAALNLIEYIKNNKARRSSFF